MPQLEGIPRFRASVAKRSALRVVDDVATFQPLVAPKTPPRGATLDAPPPATPPRAGRTPPTPLMRRGWGVDGAGK